MTGNIHSLQSLGTLDGPGVRTVLFLQGCALRCSCCHNPDTWQQNIGTVQTPQEVFAQVQRYQPFFGSEGGLTVSGGEALLQQAFVTELFTLCKAKGIHTCLDTSGCVCNDATGALLAVTDLVLLDIKYTTEALYAAHVGCSLAQVMRFLALLQAHGVPTWLRQVVINNLNDNDENLQMLADIANTHPCVKKVELLAFRKLCLEKYEALGKVFPFTDKPETTPAVLSALQEQLNTKLTKK